MANKRDYNGKRRVKSHVIADMSVNHVEEFIIKDWCVSEIFTKDYGYDLKVSTFNSKHEIEQGFILIQLKASNNLRYIDSSKKISFSTDRRDLKLWYDEPYPVILIAYNAKKEKAYWLYIQRYLRTIKKFDLKKIGKTYTVHIPVRNRVKLGTIKQFREFKKSQLIAMKKNLPY